MRDLEDIAPSKQFITDDKIVLSYAVEKVSMYPLKWCLADWI